VNAEEYVELREGRGATSRRVQDGWMVTCPAHGDRTPSLHVTEGRDGRILLHCHAGCDVDAVVAADGLGPADLYPGGTSERAEVAAYRYLDEHSTPLYEVVRFHPKDFRQRRPDGRWGIKGVRRVLYRLPQLLAAVQAGETVHVVEGEKDVHAVERAGGVATCNPMGAGKWRPEYTGMLRDAIVVVVADRDDEGRRHAHHVAAALRGVAASVQIAEPAVGKDAHDHLAADGTLADFVDVDAEAPPEAHLERLRVLDVDSMLTTNPPPVPWIVEPILARGCVAMLAGREGRGKSMLALALAAAIGRASFLLDVAGMPVAVSGLVLYVDAENGEHEAHRRIHGLEVAAGMLVYVEATNGFDLKTHLGELEALVRKHEPKLLVLDSLRSLAPGLDENDSQQAETALRPIVRLTQQLNIATLLLHHASRVSGEYRGSTAIGAAVELGFTLSRHEDDPMAATRRRLSCWKSRPAAEPDTRWLTIKPADGGGILLSEAAPYEPEHATPVLDAIVEELRGLFGLVLGSDGIGVVPKVPSGLSVSDCARELGRRPDDKTLRRALKRLEDAGVIHRNGDGRWQPSDGEEGT
jgi:hypothetical protein